MKGDQPQVSCQVATTSRDGERDRAARTALSGVETTRFVAEVEKSGRCSDAGGREGETKVKGVPGANV